MTLQFMSQVVYAAGPAKDSAGNMYDSIMKLSQLNLSISNDPLNHYLKTDDSQSASLISKNRPMHYLDTMSPDISLPPFVDNTLQIGSALFVSFALHELGHIVLGDYVGARGTSYNLFSKQDGKFYLGVSSIEHIDDESMIAYSLAGEVAADITFEQALKDYRKAPGTYNTSMMILSGTDFVRYCVYAFYLSDGHHHYDPVSFANESGISRDTIFAVALTKTLINVYRAYSGNDFVIPYFAVNKNTAMLNFQFSF